MESRLAEVVDKTVIVEVDTELSLCSCESDVVDETCSLGGDDTRRGNNNDAVLWKREELDGINHKMLWFEGKNWTEK